MPDTKNKSGIRHTLSMVMGIHNECHGLLLVMKPSMIPHDWKLMAVWYSKSKPMAITLNQSISYRLLTVGMLVIVLRQ